MSVFLWHVVEVAVTTRHGPHVMPKKRLSNTIPNALAHFDALPGSALVAQEVVVGLFSISPSTLHRRIADGTMPAPHRPSPGCSRWRVGELRQVLKGDAAG